MKLKIVNSDNKTLKVVNSDDYKKLFINYSSDSKVLNVYHRKTYSSSDFDHDNLQNTHNLTSDLSPEWNNISGVPNIVIEGDDVSVLNNDSGYITDYTVTESDITGFNISVLNNDSGFITDYTVSNSDLTGLNISELNNDIGFITDYDVTESDVTQYESVIDHDSLLNFESVEHIDWTSSQSEDVHPDNYVNTTYSAGVGLSLDGTEFNVDDVFLRNDGDTATGDYTFNTDTLHIDSTAGRVGIGTTDSHEKLHVDGNIQLGDGGLTDNEIIFGGGNYIRRYRWQNTRRYTEFDTSYNSDDAGVRFSANNDIMMALRKDGNNRIPGKLGIGVDSIPTTTLDINGAITQRPLTSDPSDPDDGHSVQWVSDGTGSGDAGDVMMKINVGGTVKTITLVDFSAE